MKEWDEDYKNKTKITKNLQTKRQPSEKALESSLWLDWSCVLFLSLLMVVLWIWFWKNHLFELHNFPPVWGFVFENISFFSPVWGCRQYDARKGGMLRSLFNLPSPRSSLSESEVQKNKLIDLSRTLCISPCTMWHIFAWEIFFGPETCLYSKCFCTIGLQQIQPINLRSEDCFVLHKILSHIFFSDGFIVINCK